MIYTIVGTSQEIRAKAKKELSHLGEVTQCLYVEHVDLLEPLIDMTSIFGDTSIVECVQLLENADAKEKVYSLLERMNASKTIFIIDEPFADANKVTKLAKVSKKLFDAREEKEKNNDVFGLCNFFVARDKKKVWLMWMQLRDKESGEAVIGALWWKFQLVWSDVCAGKKSTFTEDECKEIGGRIVRASIKAHNGEADLKEEIEKIILSV